MAQPPGQTPAAAGRGHLRASHADREHAIEVLKAAYVHGMLTKDELDARLSQALISRTYAGLAALTTDIPPAPAAAGPARAPARARRRPLAKAGAWSGGCLGIAAAAMWGAFILDPGATPTPYQSWAKPLVFVALISVLAALGILAIGMVASVDQRRSRGQLPPRPRPGGHAPDSQRRGGTGHGSVPRRPRTGQGRADLRAYKSPQHWLHVPAGVGRAPLGARPAPGAA
jgi:hypothetical protein